MAKVRVLNIFYGGRASREPYYIVIHTGVPFLSNSDYALFACDELDALMKFQKLMAAHNIEVTSDGEANNS
jgi:hypothetical protein